MFLANKLLYKHQNIRGAQLRYCVVALLRRCAVAPLRYCTAAPSSHHKTRFATAQIFITASNGG